MTTPLKIQLTPQGLLISPPSLEEWLRRGIEIVQEGERIIVQPKPESAPQAEPLSLADKLRLVDELAGAWASDASIPAIFAEIERERAAVLQVLQQANLVVEPGPMPTDYKPLSTTEKVELAGKFGVGRPLSELIMEEREAGW
jgi:hypothetical protein